MREEPKWYREEETILYSEYMNLPLEVLPDWRDFIKKRGTKRFVEYTDKAIGDMQNWQLEAYMKIEI